MEVSQLNSKIPEYLWKYKLIAIRLYLIFISDINLNYLQYYSSYQMRDY